MPKVTRPVDFEDRLTLVEHLDELRNRIIASLVVFAVALAVCFWQNKVLLDIANEPLPEGRTPITFGVAEPFTTTLTICGLRGDPGHAARSCSTRPTRSSCRRSARARRR